MLKKFTDDMLQAGDIDQLYYSYSKAGNETGFDRYYWLFTFLPSKKA
jgi:hypothetical protein